MRKFAKISLAAAVAVAGLTSVASAKPLEEAIKGVDATGYVTYRYNDTDVTSSLAADDETSTQQNVYKAAIALTIPATDDVAVKVTGVTRSALGGDIDGASDTSIVHANFVYTGVEGLTVIAGKQAISTPWTQGSSHIDATQYGTGAMALYNAGFATFAAAHFVSNNIAGTSDAAVDVRANDITAVAAIVPIMDVATAQVWYANVGKGENDEETGANASALPDGAKALVVSVDANIMDVAKVNFTHAELKGKGNNIAGLDIAKQKLDKLVVSANVGPAQLAAGYARGGSNGSLVAFDNDGSAGFKGWNVDANSLAYPSIRAYMLKAGVDVMPSLNLSLTHVKAKSGKAENGVVAVDNEIEKHQETFAQLTYKHSSNLSAYIRYGKDKQVVDTDGATTTETKRDLGRLEVAFKF